jgi:hypothetical protein
LSFIKIRTLLVRRRWGTFRRKGKTVSKTKILRKEQEGK